jgi:hypothetical protein
MDTKIESRQPYQFEWQMTALFLVAGPEWSREFAPRPCNTGGEREPDGCRVRIERKASVVQATRTTAGVEHGRRSRGREIVQRYLCASPRI